MIRSIFLTIAVGLGCFGLLGAVVWWEILASDLDPLIVWLANIGAGGVLAFALTGGKM